MREVRVLKALFAWMYNLNFLIGDYLIFKINQKMKAVIQRVCNASVTVSNELISAIKNGLCVLIGISRDDTDKDIEYIVKKILNIRLFEDDSATESSKWNKNVMERDFEILCVSQFTLQSTLKGTKPGFNLKKI